MENGVIGCMGDAWCVGGEEGLIGGVLGLCGELLKLGVVSEPAETVGNWLIFDKKRLVSKRTRTKYSTENEDIRCISMSNINNKSTMLK